MAIAPLNGRPAVTHVTHAGDGRRRMGMLTVLLTGQFMGLLDVFIVNVALPTIGSDLHASGASLGGGDVHDRRLARRRVAARHVGSRDARTHGATRPAIRHSTGGSHARSPLNVHQVLRLRGSTWSQPQT